jgi:hypothetical protein
MTGKRMPAHNFAGSRLLESFSRTLMGLQLWHWNVLEITRRQTDDFNECSTKAFLAANALGATLIFPKRGHWPAEQIHFINDLRWPTDCSSAGMAKHERVRDFMTAPPSGDYFKEKAADGWRLVAVEWERGAPKTQPIEDVPFGTRVASDCKRLEEDPDEMEVLVIMMETIVQDGPLSQAAANINQRGFRTRDGEKWSPKALFYLLPRLIEVGPRLCTSEEWVERRKHLFNVV